MSLFLNKHKQSWSNDALCLKPKNLLSSSGEDDKLWKGNDRGNVDDINEDDKGKNKLAKNFIFQIWENYQIKKINYEQSIHPIKILIWLSILAKSVIF